MKLTKAEIIAGLQEYNEWRQGSEGVMPNTRYISELLEGAIKLLQEGEECDYRHDDL